MTIRVNGAVVDEAAVQRVLAALPAGAGARVAAERAAATRELLLQRARALGLLPGNVGEHHHDAPGHEPHTDGEDGEDRAIEAVLEREVRTPTPGEAECLRFYEANPQRFRSGDLVFARHILFAVTPGAPVEALRRTAEGTLHSVREDPSRFEQLARECSNCPSGQHGGNLGQLSRGESVPEFEQELFDSTELGVLPRLVRTRYGFHVVAVDRRIEGNAVPFEAVRERIAEFLAERVQAQALAQYVRVLAGEAEIRGVDLGAATTPLVQ
jgi:peptidyl-prolyl cis-trans isomerase C